MNLSKALTDITRRLDEIIELLQPVKSDVINKGDKVIYDGNEYYYVGWSDNVHVLGDRFLRAMIGVKNGDLIRKGSGGGMRDESTTIKH